MTHLISYTVDDRIARITLRDPDRRNALGDAMFEALLAALHDVRGRDDVAVLVLDGAGPTFCAGFDLGAAVDDPPAMARFIDRLSTVNRSLRRLPQVVIAAVHGAAIAGGCALLSACDLVVVSASANLGYPVHRIGVSPAVTLPTLMQAVGPGAARSLVMSGVLIDGAAAHRIGLATHLVEGDADLAKAADDLAQRIADHGPFALRATKAWLNELDGSDADESFDATAAGSAALASGDEAVAMLSHMWSQRQRS